MCVRPDTAQRPNRIHRFKGAWPLGQGKFQEFNQSRDCHLRLAFHRSQCNCCFITDELVSVGSQAINEERNSRLRHRSERAQCKRSHIAAVLVCMSRYDCYQFWNEIRWSVASQRGNAMRSHSACFPPFIFEPPLSMPFLRNDRSKAFLHGTRCRRDRMEEERHTVRPNGLNRCLGRFRLFLTAAPMIRTVLPRPVAQPLALVRRLIAIKHQHQCEQPHSHESQSETEKSPWQGHDSYDQSTLLLA